MTFILAVILTALAILFLLTALALSASDQVRHPIRVGGALTVLLIIGLALLME
jgi:hypothetical protein